MRSYFIAAIGALLLVAAVNGAPAADNATLIAGTGVAPIGKLQTKAPTASGGVAVSQSGGVLAPLTASECTALGGEVGINSVCKSKQSCQRKDENGKNHEVCLSVQ